MREWLKRRLDQLKPRKSRSGLARHLGLQPARITEMIAGGRAIKAEEIGPMASYLEVDADQLRKLIDGTAELHPLSSEKSKEELRVEEQSLPPQPAEEDEVLVDKAFDLMDDFDALPPYWQERVLERLNKSVKARSGDKPHPSRRAKG